MEKKNSKLVYLWILPIIFTVIYSITSYWASDAERFYGYRWWIDNFISEFLGNGLSGIRDTSLLMGFYIVPIMNVFLLFYSWKGVITGLCTTVLLAKTKKPAFAFIYILTFIQLLVGAHIGINVMMSV